MQASWANLQRRKQMHVVVAAAAVVVVVIIIINHYCIGLCLAQPFAHTDLQTNLDFDFVIRSDLNH